MKNCLPYCSALVHHPTGFTIFSIWRKNIQYQLNIRHNSCQCYSMYTYFVIFIQISFRSCIHYQQWKYQSSKCFQYFWLFKTKVYIKKSDYKLMFCLIKLTKGLCYKWETTILSYQIWIWGSVLPKLYWIMYALNFLSWSHIALKLIFWKIWT